MAEPKAQTTRGQMIGEKPPEVRTVYAPDGTPHTCSPADAREILAGGLGYTAEPPVAQTGEAIFDQAYAEIEKKKAEREQQSEQQSEPGDSAAGPNTASAAAKTDDSGDADSAGKTSARSRGKARK